MAIFFGDSHGRNKFLPRNDITQLLRRGILRAARVTRFCRRQVLTTCRPPVHTNFIYTVGRDGLASRLGRCFRLRRRSPPETRTPIPPQQDIRKNSESIKRFCHCEERSDVAIFFGDSHGRNKFLPRNDITQLLRRGILRAARVTRFCRRQVLTTCRPQQGRP